MGLTEKKRGTKSIWYENEAGEIVAKVCTKCSEVRAVGDFCKNKPGLGGRGSKCKVCRLKYYEINKEKVLQRGRDWYENNKERRADYYQENREVSSETARKWRENNPNRHIENALKWQRNNPDKVALRAQRRRARKLALPDDFTPEQMTATMTHFGGCALTGANENVHLDHVVPLSNGYGGTTYGNMIPLRGDLNKSKNDANIFEWFKRNKERFNLSQTKFDELIAYLAEINEVTPEDYRDHVYWCHENPIDLSEDDVI